MKILMLVVISMAFLGLLTWQVNSIEARSMDDNEMCRKCHVDVSEIHHELVDLGYYCIYCRLEWNEDIGAYVWRDYTDCFSCHDGVHHKHKYGR